MYKKGSCYHYVGVIRGRKLEDNVVKPLLKEEFSK
jgi:hypothetical protein